MKNRKDLNWKKIDGTFQLEYITHRKDIKVTFDLLENIELGGLYHYSEVEYRVGELILEGNINSNIILNEENEKSVFNRMEEGINGYGRNFEGFDRVAIRLVSIFNKPSLIYVPSIYSAELSSKGGLIIKSPHTFIQLKRID